MSGNKGDLGACPSGTASASLERHADRFWSKVQKGRGNKCWLWQGHIDGNGYGLFSYGNLNRRAHRIMLTLVGREPEQGLVVDHMCRNRACVNPAHLRVVTRRVNAIENSIGVAARKAAQTHCIWGHPFDANNTLIRANGLRSCRTCARNRWRAKHAPHLLEAANG